MTESMQAVVYRRYGSPDVLRLEERPKPRPGAGDVLVRVRAASINSSDHELLRGTPFMNRIGAVRTPRHEVLGADIAGVVEAVGAEAETFCVGDEVYGDLSHCGWGGFAEYVCAPASALAVKPSSLDFEQAAAVPQAGVLSLQGFRKHGGIGTGQKVLVNGAGGGMGSIAVQMGKADGAYVAGVDSGEKLDLIAALGADHVVDYRQEDFAAGQQRYDLVLDANATRSPGRCRKVLRPGGSYIVVGGGTGRMLQLAAAGPLLSVVGRRREAKKLGLLLHRPNGKDLSELAKYFDDGTIVPAIDRTYTFTETAEAFRYFETGRVQGKIVVTM